MERFDFGVSLDVVYCKVLIFIGIGVVFRVFGGFGFDFEVSGCKDLIFREFGWFFG